MVKEEGPMEWYLSALHQASEGKLAGATIHINPVTWHILQNQQGLMTEEERQTTQYLAELSYANASMSKRARTLGYNKAKKIFNPEIESLLKDGEETFLISVSDRILKENGESILNLCPRCGTLARTAKSKQCRKCFYNWHTMLPELNSQL